MEIKVGTVTHFYNRISVAVIELSGEIKVGDKISILGHTTAFSQTVDSLEVNHQKIPAAGPGDDVALKVLDYVRKGDQVYKVVEDEPAG